MSSNNPVLGFCPFSNHVQVNSRGITRKHTMLWAIFFKYRRPKHQKGEKVKQLTRSPYLYWLHINVTLLSLPLLCFFDSQTPSKQGGKKELKLKTVAIVVGPTRSWFHKEQVTFVIRYYREDSLRNNFATFLTYSYLHNSAPMKELMALIWFYFPEDEWQVISVSSISRNPL